MNSITLADIGEVAAFIAPVAVSVGFIVRQAARIERLEASAKAARAIADAAASRSVQLDAQLAAFREYVAREYTSKEAIRELETRLVDAINRLGDRFDKYVDGKDK